MTERAARIWLERHARIDDRERTAERARNPRQVGAAAEYLKESPLAVERIVAGREAA